VLSAHAERGSHRANVQCKLAAAFSERLLAAPRYLRAKVTAPNNVVSAWQGEVASRL